VIKIKLKQDEIEKFFKLHKSLMFYINQKKNLIKGISSVAEFKGPILEKVAKLRNAVAKNHNLIDSFIKENPFNFTSDELNIIENWKKGINDQFFIVKYDKDYTLFYHSETQKCYSVLYLNDSFEDMLGPYLPIWVETWLIPFNGKIIYDSLIAPYSISFGGGMRRSIKVEYEESIVKHGIITSFEKQEEKSTSDEELLKFYLKSEPNRERYWREIEKLRKKNPRLEAIYHQEQGKNYARGARKTLKRANAIGCFAVVDDTVIASAPTMKDLDKSICQIIPEEKREWVFKFRL